MHLATQMSEAYHSGIGEDLVFQEEGSDSLDRDRHAVDAASIDLVHELVGFEAAGAVANASHERGERLLLLALVQHVASYLLQALVLILLQTLEP